MTCPALVTFITLKVPVVADPNIYFLFAVLNGVWDVNNCKINNKKKNGWVN